MSRCVILSAGPVPDTTSLRTLLWEDDYIIAADGGWHLAQRLGVTPAVLVADFDSMPMPSVPDEVRVISLPAKKDVTDTAAAAQLGYEQGCRTFLLLGCTGGRLDHQHAALLTAVDLAQKGCEVTVADADNTICIYTTSPGVLLPHPGYKVSLFAFGGPVTGLTVTGLAYELTDYRLTPYDPLCVSNEFTQQEARITFREGTLLLYYSKD